MCRDNVEIGEMLLKAGAKLNLTNVYGISPLFTAAQSGQLAALRFLIKHGELQIMTLPLPPDSRFSSNASRAAVYGLGDLQEKAPFTH